MHGPDTGQQSGQLGPADVGQPGRGHSGEQLVQAKDSLLENKHGFIFGKSAKYIWEILSNVPVMTSVWREEHVVQFYL